MNAHELRLEADGAGNGRVVLEGRDVSRVVRAVRIEAGIGRLTTVELDLPVGVVSQLDGARVIVGLDVEVRELLVELGWTPPADDR